MLFPSVLTVGFFLLLELLFEKPHTAVWLIPVSFFVSLLVLYVASHNWSLAILVNMFLLSSFFFLPNAPAGIIRHGFIFILSVLFFLLTFRQRTAVRLAPFAHDVLMLSFAVLFLWFASLYNIFFSNPFSLYGSTFVSYFAVVLFSFMAGAYVHAMMTFAASPHKALLALGFGVVVGEAAWAIVFLPFSHLTLGALLFIIYYVFWDTAYRYESASLTKKVFVQNTFFLLGGTSLLLLFTPWLPK